MQLPIALLTFFNMLNLSCFGQDMKDIEILRDSFQRINFETALVNLDTGKKLLHKANFHIRFSKKDLTSLSFYSQLAS